MRDRRPQRDAGEAHRRGLVLQDADDAAGSLVGGGLQAVPFGDRRVVARGADRDRSGVWHVGEQCPESDQQLHAPVDGRPQELGAEAPPARGRLDPVDEQHGPAVDDRAEHPGARPAKRPSAVLQDQLRAVDLVVVVGLRVELEHLRGVPGRAQLGEGVAGGVGCVVPPTEGGNHDRR